MFGVRDAEVSGVLLAIWRLGLAILSRPGLERAFALEGFGVRVTSLEGFREGLDNLDK